MRKKLVNFHLWLGFTVGLLWALQGFSGALLVFHRDVYRLSLPTPSSGPMASLDLVQQRAAAAAGSTHIQRIGIFDAGGGFLVADYEDGSGVARTKIIDASMANVIADRETEPSVPTSGSIWPWIYRFHDSLAGGEERDDVIGLSGLILLPTLMAGLWIAWPRRNTWKTAFDFRRWKSLNQLLYGSHRAIGLLVGFLLLITVPCGIYMIFGGKLRPHIARAVAHELPYRSAPVAALPPRLISSQAAYEAARRHFPRAAFVSVVMPTAKAPVYTVRLRQSAEPRTWAGLTTVIVDPVSGRALDVYDAVRTSWSNRLTDAAFPIHSGEIAGTPGRLAVMLAGMTLPILYVTGMWAWWRRYSRRSKAGKPTTKESIRAPARPSRRVKRSPLGGI